MTNKNDIIALDRIAIKHEYIKHLAESIDVDLGGLRVLIDCANGAAWNIARTVFEALGARVYLIGAEPDGGNINDGVGSTHIEKLQKLVKAGERYFLYQGSGAAITPVCYENAKESTGIDVSSLIAGFVGGKAANNDK